LSPVLWLFLGVGLMALGYLQALNPDRKILPTNQATKVVLGRWHRPFKVGFGLALLTFGLGLVVIAAVDVLGWLTATSLVRPMSSLGTAGHLSV
jgi:hypothetical protein